MFNSSTQKQFWLFTDGENELERLRFEVNEKYLHEILAEAPIEVLENSLILISFFMKNFFRKGLNF